MTLCKRTTRELENCGNEAMYSVNSEEVCPDHLVSAIIAVLADNESADVRIV